MASKIWKCAFQIGYSIYCTSLGSYYFNRQLKEGRLKYPTGHSICRPLDIDDTLRIIPVAYAFDNYAYIVHKKGDSNCAVIDPGAAAEVMNKLKEHGLNLILILITHKHWDHSGGITTLIQNYKNVEVVGWKTERPETLTIPQEKDGAVVGVFKTYGENDKVDVMASALHQTAQPQSSGFVKLSYQSIKSDGKSKRRSGCGNAKNDPCNNGQHSSSCLPCATVTVSSPYEFVSPDLNIEDILFIFKVYHTPGHTQGHCVYRLLIPSPTENLKSCPIVFTGDLIFLGGMGRILEGTLEDQMQSISRLLAEFPTNTHIFPGHEYALSNLIFVEKEMSPDDPSLRNKLTWCLKRRKKRLPTFPSTLEEELNYNPFLKLANSIVEVEKTTSTRTNCKNNLA